VDPCRLQLRFWGPDASPALARNFLHSCGLLLAPYLQPPISYRFSHVQERFRVLLRVKRHGANRARDLALSGTPVTEA
jgi:hypothetical protein